uniref:hypothetical protein n=1 Tax=Gordonia sp. B7-2 TaxID=3420932 RepID=UPI003D8E8F58
MNNAIQELTDRAWDAYDANPDNPQAGHLRAWVWQFEDAADMLAPDLKVIACEVLRALSALVGDSTADLVASMPAVAEWLDQ